MRIENRKDEWKRRNRSFWEQKKAEPVTKQEWEALREEYEKLLGQIILQEQKEDAQKEGKSTFLKHLQKIHIFRNSQNDWEESRRLIRERIRSIDLELARYNQN